MESKSTIVVLFLYPQTSGQIFIGTSGDENLRNCTAQSGVYATLKNAVYSTLLAAFMTDQLVTI